MPDPSNLLPASLPRLSFPTGRLSPQQDPAGYPQIATGDVSISGGDISARARLGRSRPGPRGSAHPLRDHRPRHPHGAHHPPPLPRHRRGIIVLYLRHAESPFRRLRTHHRRERLRPGNRRCHARAPRRRANKGDSISVFAPKQIRRMESGKGHLSAMPHSVWPGARNPRCMTCSPGKIAMSRTAFPPAVVSSCLVFIALGDRWWPRRCPSPAPKPSRPEPAGRTSRPQGRFALRVTPRATSPRRRSISISLRRPSAFQDASGAITLLITADTIGTPRLVQRYAGRSRSTHELKIDRSRLSVRLFAQPLHARVIHGGLTDMYGLSTDEAKVVEELRWIFPAKISSRRRSRAIQDLEPA